MPPPERFASARSSPRDPVKTPMSVPEGGGGALPPPFPIPFLEHVQEKFRTSASVA